MNGYNVHKGGEKTHIISKMRLVLSLHHQLLKQQAIAIPQSKMIVFPYIINNNNKYVTY